MICALSIFLLVVGVVRACLRSRLTRCKAKLDRPQFFDARSSSGMHVKFIVQARIVRCRRLRHVRRSRLSGPHCLVVARALPMSAKQIRRRIKRISAKLQSSMSHGELSSELRRDLFSAIKNSMKSTKQSVAREPFWHECDDDDDDDDDCMREPLWHECEDDDCRHHVCASPCLNGLSPSMLRGGALTREEKLMNGLSELIAAFKSQDVVHHPPSQSVQHESVHEWTPAPRRRQRRRANATANQLLATLQDLLERLRNNPHRLVEELDSFLVHHGSADRDPAREAACSGQKNVPQRIVVHREQTHASGPRQADNRTWAQRAAAANERAPAPKAAVAAEKWPKKQREPNCSLWPGAWGPGELVGFTGLLKLIENGETEELSKVKVAVVPKAQVAKVRCMAQAHGIKHEVALVCFDAKEKELSNEKAKKHWLKVSTAGGEPTLQAVLVVPPLQEVPSLPESLKLRVQRLRRRSRNRMSFLSGSLC